jgi:DNA-binding IclR family transcriptional regulator
MKQLTPRAIALPAHLRARLDEILRTGFSLNRGERRSDVAAIAAPVFGARGECVAAVSVTGPATRFKDDNLEALKRRVHQAAEDVSGRLGYRAQQRGEPEP